MLKSPSKIQLQSFGIESIITCHKCHYLGRMLGAGTSENVEIHVQKNVGWILFKIHNFYIFPRYYTIVSSKCEFGDYI